MKQALFGILIALSLISNAFSWTIYWNNSVAIPQAQKGADGAVCITSTSKVGETVSLESKLMTIKNIIGATNKCNDQFFSIQATLDSDANSINLEKRLPNITIPDGFQRNYKNEAPALKEGPLFYAIDPKLDAGVALFVFPRPPSLSLTANPKESDLENLAKIALSAVEREYENPVVSQPIKLSVNGVTVWRNTVRGILRNANHKIPMISFQSYYEGDTQFIFLRQWTREDKFDLYKNDFEGTAKTLVNASQWQSLLITNSQTKKEPTSNQAIDRLTALKELFDKGLITKKEYDTKRAEILKGM